MNLTITILTCIAFGATIAVGAWLHFSAGQIQPEPKVPGAFKPQVDRLYSKYPTVIGSSKD